jgi:ketosteroid isomerase-like protein
MKNLLLLFTLCSCLVGCKSTKISTLDHKQQINKTLNDWHEAAAKAQFETYFSLMTPKGVFIGTDATENWQNEAFRAFSKPYFDKGKAWSFSALERNVYINEKQDTAWFDELLDTQMKICRGSGVLVKSKGKWKIAHYVLSMTIPNEHTNEVVKTKSAIENEVIEKLKSKTKR